ncbi:rod shape-determining protein RodA [Neobacillus notoginsengisoli]|uniref:Rod shape-determining protein RodA n=1 Tax=Neobacillus notoginsengisoli TaxID=1578198 RepID=A0A417YXT0_9BACI|nr:FtsW/RodA/SpoVE family cell cycle protein [Neobacillus notoginsengisoli]RHW42592.1 rod shape-determining protein RodA [Neobacillus notoginsengisoli]
MDKFQKNYFDTTLLFIIFLFMIISCISVYSSQKYLPYQDNFALKQAVWFVAGLGFSSIIYLFDFEQIKRISPFVYIFGILVLLALFLAPEPFAKEIKGAKAWFLIPGFGSLQPSEFMKVFLILFVGKIIVNHNELYFHRTTGTDLLLLCKIGLATALPLAFILLQPDAGTAMVVTVIVIGMIFVSGINWRIIALLGILAAVLLGGLVYIYIETPDLLLLVLDQYQLNRVDAWLHPFKYRDGISYQLANSILAIGSGTMYGKGFHGAQVIVPEAHSDFIFTIIGEEFGFFGASIVISLYFILIYRIIVIALQNKGQYESIIATGVISMLTFHIFENIGMVIGLVPITGIPLPLLSYGGSSLLSTLLALSIILNISAKTKKYMFGEDD